MTTTPVPVAAAAQKVTKTPEALSDREKALAWTLVGVGVALILGLLIWFGASSGDFGLKSKEITTTEPVGGTGTKTTKQTDYADTVVIFGLTLGGALLLAGAFYGRLREITVGGAILKVGPSEEQKAAVGDAAEKKVREKAPDQAEAFAPLARALAESQLEARSFLTVGQASEAEVLEIAEGAATRVVDAASEGR